MTSLEKEIMAHGYLYYVLGRPVISDGEYDALEKKISSISKTLLSVGSNRAEDYPGDVIEYAEGKLR